MMSMKKSIAQALIAGQMMSILAPPNPLPVVELTDYEPPSSGRANHHHNSLTKKQWQKRKARLRMQKQSRKANR